MWFKPLTPKGEYYKISLPILGGLFLCTNYPLSNLIISKTAYLTERQLAQTRKEVPKAGGDLMENTTQTNRKTTCEPPHRATDESGLATCENAY